MKHVRVMALSLFAAVALFVLGGTAMEFVWVHFVFTDPDKIGLGEGLVAVVGDYVVGTVLGLTGLILFLYRFWPKKISK